MPRLKQSLDCRLAGLLVPVFSLRGEHDLGIGDVAGLRDFVTFAGEVGFGFVQLLPINETGSDNSPYNAISSVALEPLTLDCTPRGLKDLSEDVFNDVLLGYDLGALNAGPVRYAEVRNLKHELLHRAFDHFMEHVDGRVDLRANAFDTFCRQQLPWLNDYCLFRLLMDRAGGSQVWQEWDEPHRTKASALARLTLEAETDPDAVDRELRYYAYVQWVAFEQWIEVAEFAASRGVSLMGDIPFGVSLSSVDVWANQEIFDLSWYGGAPPERLFKDDEFVQKWGQNWGIPNYRWDVLEEQDYRWWRQRIAKTTEIFGMFRVDHALGFYRIYSFPWNPIRNAEFLPLSDEEAAERCDGRLPGFRPRDDASAEHRFENRAEGEKYLRMILEAAAGSEVIAEDLGTVPDYVRPSLAELDIAGMKVPQWEFTEGYVTQGVHYPARSFATYATHDHAPLRAQWEQQREHMSASEPGSGAWWDARNFLATLCGFAGIEMLSDQPPEYSEEVRERLLRGLCFSHSDRAAIMISDLLGETERINVPGVMDGTNWSYRLGVRSRELASAPEYHDLRESTKKVLNETGRSRRVGGF